MTEGKPKMRRIPLTQEVLLADNASKIIKELEDEVTKKQSTDWQDLKTDIGILFFAAWGPKQRVRLIVENEKGEYRPAGDLKALDRVTIVKALIESKKIDQP